MDTEDTNNREKVTFYFVDATNRQRQPATIIAEISSFGNSNSNIQSYHNNFIKEVRRTFNKARQGRSVQDIERYTKNVSQEELEEFRNRVYNTPASSTFIDNRDTNTVKNYVDSLIEQIANMTTYGGKRTKRRRGKKSKKRRASRRKTTSRK